MCDKTAVSQERMRLFYPTRLIWLAFESFFPFSTFGLSFTLLMPRFFAFPLISFFGFLIFPSSLYSFGIAYFAPSIIVGAISDFLRQKIKVNHPVFLHFLFLFSGSPLQFAFVTSVQNHPPRVSNPPRHSGLSDRNGLSLPPTCFFVRQLADSNDGTVGSS